jgi:hypothetical protein
MSSVQTMQLIRDGVAELSKDNPLKDLREYVKELAKEMKYNERWNERFS